MKFTSAIHTKIVEEETAIRNCFLGKTLVSKPKIISIEIGKPIVWFSRSKDDDLVIKQQKTDPLFDKCNLDYILSNAQFNTMKFHKETCILANGNVVTNIPAVHPGMSVEDICTLVEFAFYEGETEALISLNSCNSACLVENNWSGSTSKLKTEGKDG